MFLGKIKKKKKIKRVGERECLPLTVLLMCLTVYESRVRLGAFGLAMTMRVLQREKQILGVREKNQEND